MDFFLLFVSDWIRYLFRETLALVDYTMVTSESLGPVLRAGWRLQSPEINDLVFGRKLAGQRR